MAQQDQTQPSNPNSVAKNKPKPNYTLLSFPSKEMPHSILLVFKKYKYKSIEEGYERLSSRATGSSNRSSSAGVELGQTSAVQLPFPTSLTDNTSLRVGGFERDPGTESLAAMAKGILADGMTVGDAINNGKNALGNLFNGAQNAAADPGAAATNTGNSLLDMGKSALNSVMNTDLSQLTKGGAYLLRSNLPGTTGKSVDLALGSTINPRETLAFEGVNLKSHAFAWELYPSNKEDSTIIRNIVNTVKSNILPKAVDLQLGSGDSATTLVSKAFLDYPSTVDMYLMGVNQEHFIKFKTCLVNDFNVDYGGGGIVSIIKGGKPAKVTISMTLSELQIHTADDYPDGNVAPGTETTPTTGDGTSDGGGTTP